LFERLYEFETTNGLISERIATRQFEEHSQFKVKAILDTFKEERKQQNIIMESIYNALKKAHHI